MAKVEEDVGAKTGNCHDTGAKIIKVRADLITVEAIIWVWKDWLAKGMFHILAGVPGTLKTTIALSYAAIISSGGTWPDGTPAEAGDVLMWTSEDDPGRVLIPRLMRMGANLSRIHFIKQTRGPDGKPRPFNPATDMPVLEAETTKETVLLILDPVVAAVPVTRNSHNNVETRVGLQPVVDFASATEAAVLGITHLTKGTTGKDPLERITGSLAFGALPRIVMGAAENKTEGDDQPPYISTRIKSNIGPKGGGFGYHFNVAALQDRPDIEATCIIWGNELEGTALELLNAAEGDQSGNVPRIEKAKQFLTSLLAKSKLPATEIERQAAAAGVSWATIKRAAKELNIHKSQTGKAWWWGIT